MRWLTECTPHQRVVAVSNHEVMLRDILAAKRRGDFENQFASIHFVYLHKPKNRLAEHLAKPGPSGQFRDLASQEYTLKKYDDLDVLYQALAAYTIECASKEVPEVADEIILLLGSLGITLQRSGPCGT